MASSLIAVAAIVLTFFTVSQADLIGNVCRKSVNPKLCNNALRSDPRSRGANLPRLGQIALKKSITASQATINAARSVRNRRNGDIVDTCVETCGDAIDNLRECQGLLNSGNARSINDIKTKASAALTDVETCDDEFEEGGVEPRRLKAATKKAKDLIDVLLVVANGL